MAWKEGRKAREMEDMFGFFTIGKCKGRVKGGGYRGGIWVMLSRFPFFSCLGLLFFGVYFLFIAVGIVVSLRDRTQNALILASFNMGIRRRCPALSLQVEEAGFLYMLTTFVGALYPSLLAHYHGFLPRVPSAAGL